MLSGALASEDICCGKEVTNEVTAVSVVVTAFGEEFELETP